MFCAYFCVNIFILHFGSGSGSKVIIPDADVDLRIFAFVSRRDLYTYIVLQVTHLAVKQTSGGFTCWLVSILSQGNN
jgi:hypothetical protein